MKWVDLEPKLRELVNDGVPVKSFAFSFGVSPSRMYQVLQQLNIKINPNISCETNCPKKLWLRNKLNIKKVPKYERDNIVANLHLPDKCPVFGTELDYIGRAKSHEAFGKDSRFIKELSYSTPSVDRLDNSVGYTLFNVHIISLRANILKRDADLNELKQLVKYLDSVL